MYLHIDQCTCALFTFSYTCAVGPLVNDVLVLSICSYRDPEWAAVDPASG